MNSRAGSRATAHDETGTRHARRPTRLRRHDSMTIGVVVLLAALASATPAHALHQRLASLAFPAGSSPTCAALDETRRVLLVGTVAAASAPELIAIDLGTNLQTPNYAWSVELGTTVNAVAVDGNLALLATDDDGAELVVIDLDTHGRVGSFDAAGAADGLSVRVVAPGIVKLGRRASDAPELYKLDTSDPSQIAVLRAAQRPRAIRGRRVRDVPHYAYSGRLVGHEEIGDLLYLVTAAPGAAAAVVERVPPVAFADANGDGVWRLGCVGDSNTALQPGFAKWCDLLRDAIDDPDFAVSNVAVAGATVTANKQFDSDATQQMAEVLSQQPDAVVLAFGTNDRFQGRTPEQVEAAYEVQADVAAQAGVAFYVATTPPLGRCIAGATGLPCSRIPEQNALLRTAFGANVLEFFADFSTAHFFDDRIHLNAIGQALRAERALDVLLPR